jgi:aromatic ring-cleaving dioxygenase
VTSPNPLVAPRTGAVGGWDGVWIAEDLGDVLTGVRSGNWIDTSIGGFAASMDALAFVTDPLGTLVSWGVAWLMEHVKPLRDALDWLAGDPAQITAYAQTWHNVAASVRQAGTDLAAAVGRDLAGWTGAAGDAYRGRAGSQAAALGAIGDAAEATGVIVEGAGLVVALVRQLVRDLIAEFVSILAVRLWEWLAEEAGTLGIGTPWVIAQVSTLVAKWAAKITRLLHGLAATLRRLAGKIGELGKLIESLRALIKRSGGVQPGVRVHGGTRSSRPHGNDYEKLDKWSEDAYENIRLHDDADVIAGYLRDAPRIDGSRGFSADEIAQIRRHVFFEEHPIQDYDGVTVTVQRYDASPDMAEAWLRLRTGRQRPEDIALLEHELAESRYYQSHPGAIYQEAHAAANQVSNWERQIPEPTYEDYAEGWARRGWRS